MRHGRLIGTLFGAVIIISAALLWAVFLLTAAYDLYLWIKQWNL